MIKLAIIIERANIQLGGAERSIHELAQILTESGVDVTLLAATGATKSPNIKVLCDNNKKRTSLTAFAAAIKSHLKTYDYDIIHSTLPLDFTDIYQPRGGAYPEAIIRNAESFSNPLQRITKKYLHYFNLRRTELLIAERNLCNQHNHPIIAALSEYVSNQFIKHYSIDSNRITLIPNAVQLPNADTLKKSEKLNTAIRGDLNIDNDTPGFVYLFAANNYRLKGLNTLLDAVKIIQNIPSAPNICVAVAGNDKKQMLYEKLTVKLDVVSKIVFIKSIKSIYEALEICDAAVLPTYFDPCSRFILEGLAAGKPVITTKFNGAAEFFENGKHGIILDDPSDPCALAEAMIFYAQKNNAQNASNAIMEDRLADNISIKRHVDMLIELYEKIIEEKNRK
jgi:UDP-glucose:(heptosyl)LPS alpha-1,3-glucosyltransferase